MLLNTAIEQYLAHRAVTGMAKQTLRADKITLRHLMTATGNINTASLDVRHVDMMWNQHPEWAPATVNLRRTCLEGFFTWLRHRGHLDRDRDPLVGLKSRRTVPRDWIIIPPDEFDTVLAAARSPRDRVLVALGLYLFTRVSESLALRWGDVHLSTDTVNVYRSKTREYDSLPICAELEQELLRWKRAYEIEVGAHVRPGWYVVPKFSRPVMHGTGKGGLRQVTPPAIIPTEPLANGTAAVRRVLEAAGYLAPREGGHTLRRSGATALYHQLVSVGHDRAIRMCQTMLGHKNLATTEVYLRLDLDRKARNDLLGGKPMFPDLAAEADVIPLNGSAHGQEDVRSV